MEMIIYGVGRLLIRSAVFTTLLASAVTSFSPLIPLQIACAEVAIKSPEDRADVLPEVCVLGDFPSVTPKCGEEVTVTQTIIRPGISCSPLSKVVRGECDCEQSACDCVLGDWPPEPECGDRLITFIRPIAREATLGGKGCPVETKLFVPKVACRCGDGILSEGEECEGADLGAFEEDIRKSRNIPADVPISCSPACTLVMGPYCGDGVIQSGEQCEGAIFAADLVKPSEIAAPRWAAKTCTSECKVRVPDFPCVEESFVKEVMGCSQFCTKVTCEGLSPTETCGQATNCQPCEGVKPQSKCTKTGGMVAGFHSVAGRVNFFTYGKDGKTVCFSESCLRPKKSFDPDARITLADGSVKAAKDIRATDLLMGRWGKGVRIKEIFESEEATPLYRLKVGSNTVTLTEKHVVWTKKGLIQARDLRAGDHVTLQDGSISPLDSVERLPVKINQKAIGIWVDASSDEERLIFGGGILVGDYGLEKELDR